MHTRYSSSQAAKAAQHALDRAPHLEGSIVAIEYADAPTTHSYETWHVLWQRKAGTETFPGRPYVIHTLVMNDEGQAPSLYSGHYDLTPEGVRHYESFNGFDPDATPCESCGYREIIPTGDWESTVSRCGQYADGKCQRELCGECFDRINETDPCCSNQMEMMNE